MRLESGVRTVVDLTPVRYQFGSSSTPGDWDANWLVIRGSIALADGRSWSFSDPCLTTWEARDLTSWFRGVLSGHVWAAPFDGDEVEGLLMFTEPNLAFSLAARDGESVTLRVHFSLESGPLHPREAMVHDIFAYYIEVSMTHPALAAAVDEWEREIAAFPVR